MAHPERNGTTMARRVRRRAGDAPHRHAPVADDGATDGVDATLVALAIALQDGCEPCVQHHAAAAGDLDVPQLQVLEALGTALLLSTPHADRWPRLALAALEAHGRVTS